MKTYYVRYRIVKGLFNLGGGEAGGIVEGDLDTTNGYYKMLTHLADNEGADEIHMLWWKELEGERTQ